MLGGSPTWRCPEPALHLAPTGGGGGADGCRQRRTGAGLGLSGFAEPGARAATATRQEDTGSRDPQGGAPPDHLGIGRTSRQFLPAKASRREAALVAAPEDSADLSDSRRRGLRVRARRSDHRAWRSAEHVLDA